MTYNEDMVKEFKRELKDLLTKYNAIICFNVGDGSDTYGLCDERMTIEHRIGDSWNYVTLLEVNGWGIDKSDIE
jgi:hypothetical protein